MSMGAPVAAHSYSVSADGSVVLCGADGEALRPTGAVVERSYERPKGPKVLSRVPLASTDRLVTDSDQAVLAFDTLFAIDANTREIGGHQVSVAAITLCKQVVGSQPPRFEYAVSQALEFCEADRHPDLLALMCFGKQFQSTSGIDSAGRVGVVMDSHLGILAEIEARELPVLDDFFLPDGLSIVYASDAASDRLPNVLIRASDRAATDLLRRIESGELGTPPQARPLEHTTYFRVWNRVPQSCR